MLVILVAVFVVVVIVVVVILVVVVVFVVFVAHVVVFVHVVVVLRNINLIKVGLVTAEILLTLSLCGGWSLGGGLGGGVKSFSCQIQLVVGWVDVELICG